MLDRAPADLGWHDGAGRRRVRPAGGKNLLPRARRTSVGYCVRAPLLSWLSACAVEANGLSVLDVGCGDRRYETLFTGNGASYVAFDGPWNPVADLVGEPDGVPVADASFDLVLCTQVLEHLPDPAAAVRELRRIVRPGGRVLASTHGTYVYHPHPLDLWRWTQPGLEKLFRDNGEWAALAVTPAQGTAATTAMLVAHLVDLAFKRLRMRPLGRPLVGCLNLAGGALDGLLPMLRRPVPGSLTATFHIDALA